MRLVTALFFPLLSNTAPFIQCCIYAPCGICPTDGAVCSCSYSDLLLSKYAVGAQMSPESSPPSPASLSHLFHIVTYFLFVDHLLLPVNYRVMQSGRYINIFRMRRALREAEVPDAMLLLNILMPQSHVQALKLKDYVPATEETQIACQQARMPLFCPCLALLFSFSSLTRATSSARQRQQLASGFR